MSKVKNKEAALKVKKRGCLKSPIIEAVIANEVKQSVKIQIDCFSRPSFAMTVSNFLDSLSTLKDYAQRSGRHCERSEAIH